MKHGNLVLPNELRKVELPPRKIWKADFSNDNPSSERTDQETCFVQLIFWPQNYQQINNTPTVFSSRYQNKKETKKKKKQKQPSVFSLSIFFDKDKNRMM